MMYSTEEKKGTSNFEDTATTQFYTCQNLSANKKESKQEPLPASEVEDEIAKVRESLASSQQLLKRLESNEEINRYVQDSKQQLSVVKARTTNQLNNVKLSFDKNFGSLDRQLATHRKNWKSIKEKAMTQMEEQIGSFNETLKKDQTTLNKKYNTINNEIKSKSTSLMQELKEIKKQRGQSTTTMMGIIEQGRAKLEKCTQSQRKKRNQYQNIVIELLDRTVEEGQRILRRIC